MDQLRRFLTALFAFPLLFAVSACSTTAIAPTTFVGYSVPAPLRQCADEPARLTGEFTQRDVAVYLVKLRAAHLDCSGNLAAVDEILTKVEQELASQATE